MNSKFVLDPPISFHPALLHVNLITLAFLPGRVAVAGLDIQAGANLLASLDLKALRLSAVGGNVLDFPELHGLGSSGRAQVVASAASLGVKRDGATGVSHGAEGERVHLAGDIIGKVVAAVLGLKAEVRTTLAAKVLLGRDVDAPGTDADGHAEGEKERQVHDVGGVCCCCCCC